MAEILNLPWVADPHKALDEQPNPFLIEKLEELLACARRGHIVGLAYAFERRDTGPGTGWVPGDDADVLMAAICYLQHRYAAGEIGVSTPFELTGPEDSA